MRSCRSRPEQDALAFEICQSVALDCGSYTKWRNGEGLVDVAAYVEWVERWRRHPAFDFAIIPDQNGTEDENNRLFALYHQAGGNLLASVPVWHMHERFERLAELCRAFPRVALGSSGEWAVVSTPEWWQRMGAAMDFVCDEEGRPPCKLHGLRMLNPTVFSQLPLASADSSNVAQNHARERKHYRLHSSQQSEVLIKRIEGHASAPRWTRTFGTQMNMDLIG
jgi:hypothetical protein